MRGQSEALGVAFKIGVRQKLSEEVTFVRRAAEWTEASHGQSWGRWCRKCKGPGAGLNMGCLKNMVSKGDQRGEELGHQGHVGCSEKLGCYSPARRGVTGRDLCYIFKCLAVRMWRKRNPHVLLMGMENGAATVGNSLAVAQKLKH